VGFLLQTLQFRAPVQHDFRFSLLEAPTPVRDLCGFTLGQMISTAPVLRS